jgi:hypothetical protein
MCNNNIIFILFQGAGTNLKSWNEHTKSKFLDKLKLLGNVYMYQDKINNIWHYDKTDPGYIDFDDDIDFDLSYIDVKNHIKMVHNDIMNKYKNIKEYKFFPIGWSAGCLFALYFAQKYKKQCIHCILLDSVLWTPDNMKLRLESIDESGINDKPVSNKKFKKMLEQWKSSGNIEDMYKINDVSHHIRSTFFSKHLKLRLPVSTTSFINIQKPEKNEWSKDFNNKNKLSEIKILKEHNPDKYEAVIFTNQTHYIFDNIEPATKIIKKITKILSSNGSLNGGNIDFGAKYMVNKGAYFYLCTY